MERKSYPTKISVNMLSELTGKDRATVTKRLRGIEPLETKRKGRYYDLKTALRLVFEPHQDEPDDDETIFLNPQIEKARLDKARRISVELDNEIKKKNLIPKDELKEVTAKIFGGIRSKFLNLPTKLSQAMPEKPTRKQIKDVAEKETKAILKELSESEVYESL